MAEAAEEQLTAEQQATQQEFAHNMAMAFGEKPPTPAASAEQKETPTPEGQQQPNADAPSTAEKITNVQPSADPDTEVVDTSVYLKNIFGWENEEIALAELKELRELKDKPASEIKFSNDQSKQIHELLRTGDKTSIKKVVEILETQDRIESYVSGEVTKDSAPEIIKLGLYLNSGKRLSKDEVDFQYKQEYGIPKEPVQKSTEDDDDFKERHDEWKEKVSIIETKKIVAAKMAIPQLEQLKQKIELPIIDSPQNNQDKDYEDWKAGNAKADENYVKVVVPGINALKESDLLLSVKVDDPKNQMQFEVSVVPDKDVFTEVQKESMDTFGWLGKLAFDEKGNFNATKLTRAILLEKYFDKFAQSIARQAVNAERKRVVSKESAGGGIVRDFNISPEQKTEIAKQADMAFSV